MNRAILRFAVLIILSIAAFTACKKTHPLHPYPENQRLLNFTKTSTPYDKFGNPGIVINENFRFIYDVNNRVSQITHTTNAGLSNNLISNLTYRNDTIYDTTRFVNLTVKQVDTFITNLSGQITRTFINGAKVNYGYLGKVLSRKEMNDTNFIIYNSYNGNIIKSVSSLVDKATEEYTYYTDLPNRTGDYFQLENISRYGFNFMQNSNLIYTLKTPSSTSTFTYVIDADSKITKTTAKIVDTSKSYVISVYDLQYEVYK